MISGRKCRHLNRSEDAIGFKPKKIQLSDDTLSSYFCDGTALIRSHFVNAKDVADGVPTPLGVVETWSPSLKSVFSILLNSGCPMFLVWDYVSLPGTSSQHILFYNEAYLSLLNETQHLNLSDPANNRWTEHWSTLRADVEQVLTTGQALQHQQNLIPTELNGKGDGLLYTWSYNAVWDEIGQIRGVFATGFQAATKARVAPAPTAEQCQDGQKLQSSHQSVQTPIERVSLQEIEALLRESKARFTAFMNHSPTAAWIADPDGRLLYLNPTYFQMFHFPQQGAVGKQIQEIYSEEVAQQFLENNRRVFETGQVIETVETAPRPDGSMGNFLVYKFPITQGTGEILLGGVAVDITEHKRTEELLRHREEELRLITNALPALIAYVDKDRYYRFNNQAYETWFGRSANSLVGQHVRDVLGDAAYEVVRPHMEQALLGQRVSFESQIPYQEGDIRYIQANYVPNINSQGEVEGYFSLISDISDRKQAEAERERLLETLATERIRFEAVLRQLPEGIIIADAASEAMILANERVNQIFQYTYELNFELSEYEQQVPFQVYRPNGQMYAPHEYPLVRSLRAGEVVNHEEMTVRYLDGRHLVIEANAAPIFDEQGKITSAIVLIQDITERKQAEAEREQLLVQEKLIREAAEAAEQRAEFLAAASKTLASSLDYEYTLRSVAQAVVPTLADWCAIDILKDDGTLERLATAHVDPAKVQWGLELHRRYPPDLNAPRGIAQVLRTGQSEYYPTISDDQIVAAARDEEHLKFLREIGFSSLMLVPLNARGRTLGIISFVATESRYSYSLEDLSLAEELARRAAIALDNARLYRDAQQAQQTAERAAERTSRLQRVTAALSELLTPEQVAEVIVEQSMAILEATAALVVLVSNNRTELEIVKSVGYQADLVEAWRRFSINTNVPLAEAIRTGEPVWIETILDRITRYPHLAEIYNRYEFNAWITLPLVVEGKSIGGMLLSFTEFRLLNQEDRDFILALTQQCAQAIVRAQLYEAERQARAEAEQANRIKDEFLAVLSHELRSPLNPILGWSRLLQTRPFDQAETKRALETIERNAKLQTQLIDDLLDVSRILRGKLVLDGCPTNLVNVINAAFETVRLSAETKDIAIQKVVEGEVGLTLGDAGRLQQVVWNLLSNAVKFTPEGGQIEIRLEQIDNQAQIQVIDTGKGIAPEFLPHVFEYFRQEDGATTRRFGGLGLGLAIVRHLVELHGGTVQAASLGEGKGSTFTVRLPLLRNTDAQIDTTDIRDLSFSICQPLTNVQVLVVDDEPDSRELVASVLEQAGATVMTATTAPEALTMLMRSKPNVLLSDIGMPEIDGYMLMQQVRALPAEHGGQVPAIALTAYAGEIDQQQALAAGFQQHLAKPIEPEALVRAIATLVKA
jgi:PAS domain S-box-containing protein